MTEDIPWSVEDIQTLKDKWAAGATATQISGFLKIPRSRNAVIGKIFRLKLAGHHMRKPVRLSANRRLEIDTKYPSYDTNQCALIDGEGANRLYCDQAIKPNKPYCPAHCDRAYIKIDPKRDPANPKKSTARYD